MLKKTLPLFFCLPILGFAETGWSVGVAMISNDNFSSDQDNAIFPPTIVNDNRQYMLFPDIRYDWEQWSAGFSGVEWHTLEDNEGPDLNAKLGVAGLELGARDNVGWFHYGAHGGITYDDGWRTKAGIQLGPLRYEQFNELTEKPRALGQEVAVDFPLYFNKAKGLGILGNAALEYNNAEQQTFLLDNDQVLLEEHYLHYKLGVMVFYNITEQLSLISSVEMKFNDQDLVNEINAMNDHSYSVFILMNYRFGN